MNKTKIEWTDYSWNPVTGCRHGCPYCYARTVTERFKNHYPNGFEPTFWPDRLQDPDKVHQASKIFVCSMADMFGWWVEPAWIKEILETTYRNPHHTFQILTKNPIRIVGHLPMGHILQNNLWVGTTVENQEVYPRAYHIKKFKGGVRFISFEPLLGPISPNLEGIDWVIIGGLTGPRKKPPKSEWVENIIQAAATHSIPVFLKKNTGPLFYEFGERQEYPK